MNQSSSVRFGIRLVTEGGPQAARDIRVAGDAAQQTADQLDAMAQAGQRVGGSLLSMFAAMGAALSIREFIQQADAMNLLDARLRNAVGSGKEFAESQREIYRIAQQNNVGLQEATQLYIRMADPVKRLGGTTKEVAGIVDAFAMSLRVGGASTMEAASATLQFAQAMGSGKLSGDEFRAMAEASPRFMQALADGMGVPIEKLKQMGADGKLTADVVGNALLKALDALKAEAATLPDTVGGAFTRAQNEAMLLTKQIDGVTGATSAVAEVVGMGASLFSEFARVLKLTSDESKGVVVQFDLVNTVGYALGKVFETVVLLGSDVAFMLKTIGTEIGGLAAMAAAVMAGDLQGAKTIWNAINDDVARSRQNLDAFQARVSGMTERVLQARDAMRAGAISTSENAAEMAKLARQAGNAGNGFVVLKGNTAALTDEQKAAADAAKKLADAGRTLAASFIAQDQGLNPDYQLKVRQLLAALSNKPDELRAAMEALIKQQPYFKAAMKADKDAADATLKSLMDDAKRRGDAVEKASDLIDAILRETDALKMSNLEREVSNALLSLERTGLEKGSDAWSAYAERVREAIVNRETIKANIQATRDIEGEWKKTSDQIGDALANALMEGGKSASEYIEGVFRTMVLKPVIQAIVNPVANAITGYFSSAFGSYLPSAAGAASGSGFMGAAAGTTITSGTMLGNGFGTAYANMTGTGIDGLLATNNAFGTGGTAASSQFGALAPGFAGAASAYGFGQRYGIGGGILGGAATTAGVGAVSGLVSGSGAMAGASSALGGLGPWGWAAIAAMAILGSMDDSGTPHAGGTVEADKQGVRTTTGKELSFDVMRVKGIEDSLETMASSTAGVLNMMGAQFGGGDYAVGMGFADDSSKDASWGALRITKDGNKLVDWNDRPDDKWPGLAFANGEEGFSQYTAAIGKDLRSIMDEMDLPDWARKTLDALGEEATTDTLMQAAGTITQIELAIVGLKDAMDPLGGVFRDVSGLSSDALYQLGEFAGGLDALSMQLGGYVQNFYQRDEIAGLQAAEVVQAMRGAGFGADIVSGLDTRQEFRDLVESIDASTEDGRRQLATLLGVQGVFANLSTYFGETGRTLGETAALSPGGLTEEQLATVGEAAVTARAAAATQAQITAINEVRDSVDKLGPILERIAAAAASNSVTVNVASGYEVMLP